MNRHLDIHLVSLFIGILATLTPGCGGSGGSDPPAASQSEIAACQALCLRFGPESCTRQCYATCEAKGGGCASTIANRTANVISMSCNLSTVSFFDGSSNFGCTPGSEALSHTGALPAGPWMSGKRMFVTSQIYRGGEIKQMGGMATGLESGDKLCANLAAAANLGGTFKVWLSDATTNAINRIAEAGPWYNTSRSDILFKSKLDLVVQPLSFKPQDERGQAATSRFISGVPDVWTGTGKTGMHMVPTLGDKQTNCANWSATKYMQFGVPQDHYGYAGSLSYKESWSELNGLSDCSSSGHLYCFEQ